MPWTRPGWLPWKAREEGKETSRLRLSCACHVLDQGLLQERGIEMIVPHRIVRNRKKSRRRMADRYAATTAGGRSSTSLPGFITTGDSSPGVVPPVKLDLGPRFSL